MTVGPVDSLLRIFVPTQKRADETERKAQRLFLRKEETGELKLEEEGWGSRFVNRVFRRCSYDFSTNISALKKTIQSALESVASHGKDRNDEIYACISQYQDLIKHYADKHVPPEERAKYYEEHSFRSALNNFLEEKKKHGSKPKGLIAGNALYLLGRINAAPENETSSAQFALNALDPQQQAINDARNLVTARELVSSWKNSIPHVLEKRYEALRDYVKLLANPTEGIGFDMFFSDLTWRAENAERACAEYKELLKVEVQKEFAEFDREQQALRQKAAEVEARATVVGLRPEPSFTDRIAGKVWEKTKIRDGWERNVSILTDWMGRWRGDFAKLGQDIEAFLRTVSEREEQNRLQEQKRVRESVEAYQASCRAFREEKAGLLQQAREVENEAYTVRRKKVDYVHEVEGISVSEESGLQGVREASLLLEGVRSRITQAAEQIAAEKQQQAAAQKLAEQKRLEEQARALKAYQAASTAFKENKAELMSRVAEIERLGGRTQAEGLLRDIQALADPVEATGEGEPDIGSVHKKQQALDLISVRVLTTEREVQRISENAREVLVTCEQLERAAWNSETKSGLGQLISESRKPFDESSKRETWERRLGEFRNAVAREKGEREEILAKARRAFSEFDAALHQLSERMGTIAEAAQEFDIQVGPLETAFGDLQATKGGLPSLQETTKAEELETVSQWCSSWEESMQNAQGIATQLESEIQKARQKSEHQQAEFEEASRQFVQYKDSLRSRAERLNLLHELDAIGVPQEHQYQKSLIEQATAKVRDIEKRIAQEEELRTAASGADKARALLASTALVFLEGRWNEEGAARVALSALNPTRALVADAQRLVDVQERVSEFEARVPVELQTQFKSLREVVAPKRELSFDQFGNRATRAEEALATYMQEFKRVTAEYKAACQEFEGQKRDVLQQAREMDKALSVLGEKGYAHEVEGISVSEEAGLHAVQEASRRLEGVRSRITQAAEQIAVEKQRQETQRAEAQQRKEVEEARVRAEKEARHQEVLRLGQRLQQCQDPSVQRWSNIKVPEELSEQLRRAETQEETDITGLRGAVENMYLRCSAAMEDKRKGLAAKLDALQSRWRTLPPDTLERERPFLHNGDLQVPPSFQEKSLPDVSGRLEEMKGSVARLKFVLDKEELMAGCLELVQGPLEPGARAAIRAFMAELQALRFTPDLGKQRAQLESFQHQAAEVAVRRKEELRRAQRIREEVAAVRRKFEEKKEKALPRAKEIDGAAARVLGKPTFYYQTISKLVVPEDADTEETVQEKIRTLDTILSEMGRIEGGLRAGRVAQSPVSRIRKEAPPKEAPKPKAPVAAKSVANPVRQNTQKLKEVSQGLSLIRERFAALQQQGGDLGVDVEKNIGEEIEQVSRQISTLQKCLSDRETLDRISGCAKTVVSIGKLIEDESARLLSVHNDFQRRSEKARATLGRLLENILAYQGTLDRALSSSLISKEEHTKFHGELSTLQAGISRSLQQTANNKSSVELLERVLGESKAVLVECKQFVSGVEKKQALLDRIQFQIENIDGLKRKIADLERGNQELQSKKKKLKSTRRDEVGAKIEEVGAKLQPLRDRLEAAKQNLEQIDALVGEVWSCTANIEYIRREIQDELFLATLDFLRRPQTDPSSLYSSADEWNRRFEKAQRFAGSMQIVSPELPTGSSKVSYQQLQALDDAKKRRLIQVVEAFCDRQEDIREVQSNISTKDLDMSPLGSMTRNHSICRAIERIIEGVSEREAIQLSESERQWVHRSFEMIEGGYEKLALYMDQKFVSDAYRKKREIEGSAEIDVEFRRIRSSLPFKSVNYVDNYVQKYRLGSTFEKMNKDLQRWNAFVRDKFGRFLARS